MSEIWPNTHIWVPVSASSEFAAEIEALKYAEDGQKEGDGRFGHHLDAQTRLLWAFHRPGGTEPYQMQDPDLAVCAMAFNRSRLGALKRLSLIDPSLIDNPKWRQLTAKRSRMLFRALADGDFEELIAVLDRWPSFGALAASQIIHGRRMLETPISPQNASTLLTQLLAHSGAQLEEAVCSRLTILADQTLEQTVNLLRSLEPDLHPAITQHYRYATEVLIKEQSLHQLQKKILTPLAQVLKRRTLPNSPILGQSDTNGGQSP